MKIKFKKSISLLAIFALCVSLFTANVTAYGIDYNSSPQPLNGTTTVSLSPSLVIPSTNTMGIMSTNNQNSYYLGDPDFADDYRLSWKGNLSNGGTTTYYNHYFTSVGDLYVTSTETDLILSSYTNKNGTYYSNSSYTIAMFPIAYNTLYNWTHTTNYPSYQADSTDYCTNQATPRRFDIYDDPLYMGYAVLALPPDGSYYYMIDFYSVHNSLISYGYSDPQYVLAYN